MHVQIRVHIPQPYSVGAWCRKFIIELSVGFREAIKH